MADRMLRVPDDDPRAELQPRLRPEFHPLAVPEQPTVVQAGVVATKEAAHEIEPASSSESYERR